MLNIPNPPPQFEVKYGIAVIQVIPNGTTALVQYAITRDGKAILAFTVKFPIDTANEIANAARVDFVGHSNIAAGLIELGIYRSLSESAAPAKPADPPFEFDAQIVTKEEKK